MGLTHDQITGRLEQIEAAIAQRQPRFEQAAIDYFRLKHDFDLQMAKAVRRSQAKTATAQKAEALIDVAENHPELWADYHEAEASYEALKAILSSYDKRAMVGMALLKSSTREAGPQPQWMAPVGRAA